jgi:hypothetical protein
MPPTTCQNQQQVSNTDRSHLNDGDLIPQSTECDTNQQSYDHALCANALQLPIPTRITNRVSSQQQKRELRGKFRKEFNHNYNQVFRKRLPSPRTFRQPNYPRHYPRPTQTKDPSTFSNLVVSNNRRVDKDLSVKDNQLILNSDNSPADLLQSHNNNLINGAKSRDGQHMKGNSNARKLPNITDLKSLLQVPEVSATNEVDNKVDTYPIIDGHHCSLRNVSSSTFNVLKDIEFLPLISLNESLEYSHQVPVDFKRPFQENPGRKPPPSIVRSHQRSPEWLNHLALVRQLTNA